MLYELFPPQKQNKTHVSHTLNHRMAGIDTFHYYAALQGAELSVAHRPSVNPSVLCRAVDFLEAGKP